MTETPRLGLPLIVPSQAQKHVTVNEAMVRLDGLIQLSVTTRTVSLPPPITDEGACYIVGSDAGGAWAGQGNNIAISANGGWVFVQPDNGWRAWVQDENVEVVFLDTWRRAPLSISTSGAATELVTDEFEVTMTPGSVVSTAVMLPSPAMIFAVSARVAAGIDGDAISWRLGVAGSDNRFGSGLGLAAGSYADGILYHPTTHYAPEELILSAEGGAFGGTGLVRLAVHYMRFRLPGA